MIADSSCTVRTDSRVIAARHQNQSQGLAGLQGHRGWPVGPHGNPPQPGPESLLVKFQDGSRIPDPRQMITEFPQVVHAPPRP